MRYAMSWYNGKLCFFRAEGRVVEMYSLEMKDWVPFSKPSGFRFTEDPLPIAGTFWCEGGEKTPSTHLTSSFDIPEPTEGENGMEALVRIYEPVITTRQKELGKMKSKLLLGRTLAQSLLILLCLGLFSTVNAQSLYWYTGDRVNVIDGSRPGGGYFRELLEKVYSSGIDGAIVELESKNTGWVGGRWADTLESVLSRFDSTDFQIILQTRNVSKHPYGSPAPVPTFVSNDTHIPLDTFVTGYEYGSRFFLPIDLSNYPYRLFDLVIQTSGNCRLYILRNTPRDPTVSRGEFTKGVDTITFHTLDASTKYTLMLQARDPNHTVDMGFCYLQERHPHPEEVKSHSENTYEFVGSRQDGFYFSRTVDVEDREAVWRSYEPSILMANQFAYHRCVVATWHSADEVFMYGHQNFKWFNSGGEAYTFLVDEGIRLDNTIWNRPVWLWADHRESGHNVVPFERASIGMDKVYQDKGLNQVLFAWNEGDLQKEVRRMRTPGMAITLGTDNIDSAIVVARECGVDKVILQAWSSYASGSSRSKWLDKLSDICQKFKRSE